MKRASDDGAIAYIKHRLADPRDVCQRLGVDLRGARAQPNGLLAKCPAHDDRTPSCSIRIGRDGYLQIRCFGCDLAGDVFTLIAAVDGIDARTHFADVLARGAQLAGVRVERARPSMPRPQPPQRCAAETAPPMVDLHPLVLPLARLGRLDGGDSVADVEAYLASRGLLGEARAAGIFSLPPRGHEVLVDAFGAEAITASGLYRGQGWTWPRHILSIPWHGLDGRIHTLQRRHIDQQGTDKAPRYVSPAARTVVAPFGAEELTAAPPDAGIVIVEGALDVLALRRLDRGSGRVVLGVQGVKGWLSAWDGLVRSRPVWIGFDDDKQADNAAPALEARLLAAGATRVLRLRPVGAKDWAALLELETHQEYRA